MKPGEHRPAWPRLEYITRFYRSAETCLTMSLHAFSHLKHASAHRAIIALSLCLAQASPQRLQDSAHDLQINSENGPTREVTDAAAVQIDAQSWQVRRVSRCSFFPSAINLLQWVEQASHMRAQLWQASAQFQKCCSWLSLVFAAGLSAANEAAGKASPIVTAKIVAKCSRNMSCLLMWSEVEMGRSVGCTWGAALGVRAQF